MSDSSTRSSTLGIGFAMALLGGIILIIVGGLAMLGIFTLIWYPVYALASFWWGLAILIVGLLVVSASKWVNNTGAALWLIILAIITGIFGAWWASWLIFIGAIIGLITR